MSKKAVNYEHSESDSSNGEEINVSAQDQQLPSTTVVSENSEFALDTVDDNEAPNSIGQSVGATEDAKKKHGIVVLDFWDDCAPFDLSSYDDPLPREEQKKKENSKVKVFERLDSSDNIPYPAAYCDDSLAREKRKANENNEATTALCPEIDTVSDETTVERGRSVSAQCNDTDRDTARSRTNTHTELNSNSASTLQAGTAATTTTANSTIIEADSYRASSVDVIDRGEIFIPHAVAVGDIPSADVVIPDKYSITVAGRKVHAGILVLVAIVIAALAVWLAVALTRPDTVYNATSAPSVSNMPSQSPSMQPSDNPSSEMYSNLVQTIYGDDMNQTNYNIDRRNAMLWLEQDQASYNSSIPLSTNELRERYGLALLYYVSNTEHSGGWYDNLNFLNEGHVCTWKVIGGAIVQGVSLCSKENRVLRLQLASNNLRGTLPMELSFLSKLQYLQLNNNRIESTIPDDFGLFTELSHLELDFNDLTGTIPRTLERLTNLTRIDLSYNQISGELVHVMDLQELTVFRVNGNYLTGEVPASFGNLSYLDTFNIEKNNLFGSMDFMCDNLPNDTTIDCGEVRCACCDCLEAATGIVAAAQIIGMGRCSIAMACLVASFMVVS